MSYAEPYSTELCCILLNYPAPSDLCSTPLSYAAPFWATLYTLGYAAHYAAPYSTEVRCTLLSYATSTELRCTLLWNAAPCWATPTLHPLSEPPILQFLNAGMPDCPTFCHSGNRRRKMLMPELVRYQREFSGTGLRLEMTECPCCDIGLDAHAPLCLSWTIIAMILFIDWKRWGRGGGGSMILSDSGGDAVLSCKGSLAISRKDFLAGVIWKESDCWRKNLHRGE